MRPILAIDFDGVIHSYSTQWQSADIISDAPVPGAFEFLSDAIKVFDIVIYTTRLNISPDDRDLIGRSESECRMHRIMAIENWFVGHGLDRALLWKLTISATKPKAKIYLDDRAIRFDGTFPTLETLKDFRTWQNK